MKSGERPSWIGKNSRTVLCYKQRKATVFHLFITYDRNLEYQQNLQSRRIAIIALSTNIWPLIKPLIKPHVERVKEAVNSAIPGSYLAVECGHIVKQTSSRKL
jgi:hypothetical protein